MAPPKSGRCLFGRQIHAWGQALVAALRVNEPDVVIPDDAGEWVYWCSRCGRVETLDR